MSKLIDYNPIRARRLLFLLGQLAWRGRNIFWILLSIIVSGGLLFSLLEGMSLFEGQYLAFITAMTIGYGDLSPVTLLGRMVALLVGFVGLVFTGVVVAFTLKALELSFREELEELEEIAESTDSEVQ